MFIFFNLKSFFILQNLYIYIYIFVLFSIHQNGFVFKGPGTKINKNLFKNSSLGTRLLPGLFPRNISGYFGRNYGAASLSALLARPYPDRTLLFNAVLSKFEGGKVLVTSPQRVPTRTATI